jgi:hypothetical protein
MLPTHLWWQAFQDVHHELMEAVRGNPDDATLFAQLAQAVQDLEAATAAIS